MEYIEKSFSYLVPSDFNMYYCGKRVDAKNHRYGPQIRNHFLLVYIKDGNAMLALRNKCIDLHSGQLLCMFPNEKIYYQVCDNSLWSILWVGVYGSKAELYIKSLGITRDNPVYNCPQPANTEAALNSIINTVNATNTYGRIETISLLYHFLATLFDKTATQISEINSIDSIDGNHKIKYLSDNIYIREAENYIRFHYDKDIRIASIARMLNLSLEYFSRLFKKETGISPQQLIIKYRIERSCTLLKSTHFTISEISNSVGITDTRYFSKLFRFNTGLSPREYRKNQKQKK